MKRKQQRPNGFTLLEFLIVVAIIGLLSVAMMVYVLPSLAKGRDGRRKADLHKISNALEEYYNDNNSYPATSMMTACGTSNAALQPYLSKVPCEVGTTDTAYKYLAITSSCTGTTANPCNGYRLLTQLSQTNDPDVIAKGCTKVYPGFDITGCHKDASDKIYDYGIAVGMELADP